MRETESSTRPLNLDKPLYIPQHGCSPYFFNMLFIEHLLHVRHRKPSKADEVPTLGAHILVGEADMVIWKKG